MFIIAIGDITRVSKAINKVTNIKSYCSYVEEQSGACSVMADLNSQWGALHTNSIISFTSSSSKIILVVDDGFCSYLLEIICIELTRSNIM